MLATLPYDARPSKRNPKALALGLLASAAFHMVLLAYFILERHPLVLYEPAAKEIILIDSFPTNETRSAQAEAAPEKPPKPAARPTPKLHITPNPSATSAAAITASTPNNTASSSVPYAVSKSLQFGQSCANARAAGTPLPLGCTNFASKGPALGPKPVPEFEQAAAEIDQHLKYLTTPGSPDLWNKTNHAPTSSDRPNDLPEYGLYDGNAKRQRVVGQCALTASCTQNGSDPRSPNYTRK